MYQLSEIDRRGWLCNRERRGTNVRLALIGASSLAVLALATPVMAQEVPDADEIEQEEPVSDEVAQEVLAADGQTTEITVTASRVNRLGFDAPTPTTVIGVEDLQRRAANNISEALFDLPTIEATGPNVSSFGLSNSGQTYLDLRGIGASRTLTLVDGRRHVASNNNGNVDSNVIPALLVQSIEVVTGGASASWGSDAVAGVVNIILKKNLEGIEASAQYGISDRGDSENYTFSAAGGTGFAGDAGHVIIGAEYSNDHGIGIKGRFDRLDWSKNRGFVSNTAWATNGLPATIYANDIQFSNQAPGGMITGPNNAAFIASGLKGTIFNADGTTSQMQYGQVFGTSMIGGSNYNNNFTAAQPYRAPVERWAAFAHLDYEISDQLNFFAEASMARSLVEWVILPSRDGGSAASTVPAGTPAGVLIARIDNPYLAAYPDVRNRMLAAGLSAVFIGRSGYDSQWNYDMIEELRSENQTLRLVTGLDGELGIANWRWDVYYQYGRNEVDESRGGHGNRIMAKWREATDVVTSPTTGQPICRSTLTNPNNGCVPFNMFGVGTSSLAARDYVSGTGTMNNVQVQHVAAATLRGDLFNLPAGPISAAFGAEYRKESAVQVIDAISAVQGFEFTNLGTLDGALNVKEAFGELIVPIFKDAPIARALDLQLAARYTDYSTSGSVVSWKAGLTWELNDDLRVRGTVSRDIRAGNMNEFFAARVQGPFLPVDRVMNIPQPGVVQAVGQGNPNIQPEKGTTYTAGVVLQPEWLSGFRASVDYYNIEITGQIGRISGQAIIDRCADGLTEYCSLISRNPDPANPFITEVSNPYLNLDAFKTSGLDFEVSYRRPAPSFIPGGGDFTLRLLANYTHEYATVDPVGKIDRAGEIGTAPHWLGTASLTYDNGRFSTTILGRYIGAGNIDNRAAPGTARSYNIDRIGAQTLWRLSASYDLVQDSNGRQIQIFGTINNLFDTNPPFPFQPSSLTTNGLYDGIGRAYRMGVRVKL